MRAAGVIFEAKHRKPMVFLVLVFLTTLSLLFFSFQKSILGEYQPLMGSFQYPVATPMQTTYNSPYQTNYPTTQTQPQTSYYPQHAYPRNIVIMRSMLYSPSVLTVPAGTTVTWINEDNINIAHTVTSTANLWDSGTLEPGQSYSHTFSTPGTYPYYCKIHPFMQGTIVVVPSPTITVTPYPTYPTMTPTVTPYPSNYQPGQPPQQQMQGFPGSGNFQTQSQTQTNNQSVNINVTH